MAIDFSKFDSQVDTKKLASDVREAAENGGGDFPTVPKGNYVVVPEKLELGETKDHRPMLKGQFRIKEDENGDTTYKKQMLFYNRVLYGTKNDANMIASAVGFLKSLEPTDEVGPIVFESYSQFAELVLDVMENIENFLEYLVEYDPDAFNSLHIVEVYEL